MDFTTFFRQFFGSSFHHRPSEEYDNDQNQFNNEHWPMPAEFEQLDKMMNQMLQEMLGGLPELFGQIRGLQEPEQALPSLRDQLLKKPGSLESPATGSVREKMLKQQGLEMFGPQSWEKDIGRKVDVDLDEMFGKKGSLDHMLPKPRDDSGMHYSMRSSMNYSQSSNGALFSKSVGSDREGCQKEITTHEYKGKKYIVEKRLCQGAPEQLTETLINMSKDEIPEFLKRWNQPGVTTGSNQEVYDKFFGSLR